MKNVELDFSKCKYPYDFHIVIREAMFKYEVLGFPDFCGKNLDAFWDVLNGFIEYLLNLPLFHIVEKIKIQLMKTEVLLNY